MAGSDEAPTPSTSPRTTSDGYQSGSDELSPSADRPGSDQQDDDDLVDPFTAYAHAVANNRERKKREREPGIWLPDSAASGSGLAISSGFARQRICMAFARQRSPG
jgi:hypothetical protein